LGKVTIRWVDGKMMTGSDTHGHSIVIGPSPDTQQYPWVGVKPSDLLLMAAASCSVYDVVEILIKQREPFTDLKVVCDGEQMSEPPYTFTRIHLHYLVHGAVKPDKVEKAIQLSQDKYCSVIATLRPGVPISSSFEVFP